MSSRKRSYPHDEPAADIVEPVLAPREMFFNIPLRTRDVHNSGILALAEPCGHHAIAQVRVENTPALSSVQRASLDVMLTILNDYFPAHPTTVTFTRSITDIAHTDDVALATLADTINNGLLAFRARGGPATPSSTPAASIILPPTPQDPTPVPLNSITTSSASSATAVAKRARVSKKSGISTRSNKIRDACKARDGNTCRLCNIHDSLSAHIIPFSIRGSKTMDFWAFVALFRGVDATAALKAAALDPDPENPDNLMNVIQLCRNCHHHLDEACVSLVPQILEDPASVFPYDPRVATQYDVVAEFPAGLAAAEILVLQDDGDGKRLRPGHVLTFRTTNSATLPLPHPLLLQLHVVCSRMVVLRAAAGYPVLLDTESDGDTVYDLAGVGDDQAGSFVEFRGKENGSVGESTPVEESRDPHIVLLELEQRKREREQLLQKLKARWAFMCLADQA